MTLQGRLLRLLLIGAPLIWLAAVLFALNRAQHEINELFDTQQVRLAQQVISMLPAAAAQNGSALRRADPLPHAQLASGGEAELEDMSIAVWSGDGRLQFTDREGIDLPLQKDASGFVDLSLRGSAWRVYYLSAHDGSWRVAVGQHAEERDELIFDLLLSQLLPWLLMLPLLLVAMTLAVRHALRPVRTLAHDLETRHADDLRALPATQAPAELQPLLASMNALFARIERVLLHERRLTADAAHELRTPLAALRAQWEAAQAAGAGGDAAASRRAQQQVGQGIERLSHLVNQLLELARVEGESARGDTLQFGAVDWQRVVQNALSDCLPLLERSGGDLDVEWPQDGVAPLPLRGQEALLTTMLRNLIDNALRYGPQGNRVQLRFSADALIIDDHGPGVSPAALMRLGDRFYRPSPAADAAPDAQLGSGLGVSIVRRIAALHGLALQFSNRAAGPADEGSGLRVLITRAAPSTARGPLPTAP